MKQMNQQDKKALLIHRQEKVLKLLPAFESEETFLEYVEKTREDYNNIFSPKTKHYLEAIYPLFSI